MPLKIVRAQQMHVNPKDVLNRLKWKEGESLSDATIYYVSPPGR